jgi:hypothetical protein
MGPQAHITIVQSSKKKRARSELQKSSPYSISRCAVSLPIIALFGSFEARLCGVIVEKCARSPPALRIVHKKGVKLKLAVIGRFARSLDSRLSSRGAFRVARIFHIIALQCLWRCGFASIFILIYRRTSIYGL